MELQYVNTSVVRALMSLRGISADTLCTLAHVAQPDMHSWLSDDGDGSDDAVEFETQLEILRYLGIQGEAPRPDVVHYWRINEPFFSRASTTYWPLEVVLKSFGKAQVAYLARESDPAITFKAVTRFALKFATFNAILEITTSPLRSPSFDPEEMANLSWLPDSMGVLLPEKQYDALQPGSMKVKALTQQLTYTSERAQWERLREMALDKGIPAEQVASALLLSPTSAPATAQVTAAPAAQPVTAAPQPAATPVAPAAPVAPVVAQPVPVAPVMASQPDSEAAVRMMESAQVKVTPASQGTPLNDELKLFARPAQKANLRAVV